MIQAEARGAWADLERRLRPYVARRVASPDEVDDLLQEIFLKLYQSSDGLRDGESFGGWVYRVAQHAIIDHARARGRSRVLFVPEVSDAAGATTATGDADQLQVELTECVALFVSRLCSPYREAVTLTELQGLAQKDAAHLLGVSLTALKSQVRRGREKMRDMFHDCCQVSVDARGRVIECEPRSPKKCATPRSS